MAAAAANSGPAWSPAVPAISRVSSRTALAALSREIRATSSRPNRLPARECRESRTGFKAIRVPSSSTSRAGSSQRTGSRVNWLGSSSCRAAATTIAAATGIRFSPPCGVSHPGRCAPNPCVAEPGPGPGWADGAGPGLAVPGLVGRGWSPCRERGILGRGIRLTMRQRGSPGVARRPGGLLDAWHTGAGQGGHRVRRGRGTCWRDRDGGGCGAGAGGVGAGAGRRGGARWCWGEGETGAENDP